MAPRAADPKGAAGTVSMREVMEFLQRDTPKESAARRQAKARQVQALFDALRAIVVTMKSELVTVLDLELPKRVEGDND